MIKDIITILQKMESACPVECFASLKVSLRGNLILEWRWSNSGEKSMYSKEITPDCDDAMVDVIDTVIHQASRFIEVNLNRHSQ